jgi:hypothetical protein
MSEYDSRISQAAEPTDGRGSYAQWRVSWMNLLLASNVTMCKSHFVDFICHSIANHDIHLTGDARFFGLIGLENR